MAKMSLAVKSFFLVLLLTAFTLPGCAAGTAERTSAAHPSSAQPVKAKVETPLPEQTPEKTASSSPAYERPETQTSQTARPASPKSTSLPDGPRRHRTPAEAKVNPREQMLQGAGRDARTPQPEAGFTLTVPASIGDGEPFLVEFGAEGVQKLQVEWRDRTIDLGDCSAGNGLCRALLPVPLDEKSQSLPLAMLVTWADGKKERFAADMPIKKRKYPVQKLQVAQKFVTPPPEMQEKIKRDRAELRAAVSNFSNTRYWNLPLLRPVPGEVTSLYGLRRVFNNVPKNPHRGVDFDAKEGDPILALDDGIVVLAADHYYSGNIVVVDHGLGVHSSYLHLSGFNVSKGQKVSRGDTIGYIGSTGRVTGPHLHLSLYVLGVSVNAATCIAM